MCFRSIIIFALIASFVDATGRALKSGKGTKAGKQGKGTKAGKQGKKSKDSLTPARSFTGAYVGLDSEDGTRQTVSIFCEDGLCDITVEDFVFTTCILITGSNYFGGVAIARDVPENSLDNFDLNLYCLAEGQLEIDVDVDTPLTTLRGDLIGLEDGIIRRTGTGFTYFKFNGGDLSADEPIYPQTGLYQGTDKEDGTSQILTIYCKDGLCDVDLGDLGYSSCTRISGDPFFGGVAYARQVPVESLNSFTLDLFCLGPGETQFGSTPTGTLTGNLEVLKDGIVRRTGPGFTYFQNFGKSGSMAGGQVGTGKYLNPSSVIDGSRSNYDILCLDGFCDVILKDYIFPQCVTLIGTNYFGALAIARGIDQGSLNSFSLDLYCAKGIGIDIDQSDAPDFTIQTGLEVVDDNIIRQVGSSELYFNLYTPFGAGSLPSGFYYGESQDNGFAGLRSVYCENKMCDIIASSEVFNPCIRALQDVVPRPFNGVGIAKDVPEGSLDDFDIDLYCLAPAQQVELGVTVPTMSLEGDLVPFLGNDVVKALGPADIALFRAA